ncbi:hypothetical protein [Serpentinimonas maccroryi]|uniref:hypothetical protein n=1 Tax=Serpentinimonas maccroryi TaxID=1458426 RepID=UPI0020345A51|nr:hypothetical protein [Serpentinimonas maccroryi]
MIPLALALFLLRPQPFERFAYPRWQAALALTLIGLLVGLDPQFRLDTPEVPAPPLWLALSLGVLLIWAVALVTLAVLRWWMQRGQRWDGRGELFNLLVAAWLITSVLGAGLVALGVPHLLTLPLYLYSLWVGGNALSNAIPKASLGYSIVGILISMVPGLLISAVITGLALLLACSPALCLHRPELRCGACMGIGRCATAPKGALGCTRGSLWLQAKGVCHETETMGPQTGAGFGGRRLDGSAGSSGGFGGRAFECRADHGICLCRRGARLC